MTDQAGRDESAGEPFVDGEPASELTLVEVLELAAEELAGVTVESVGPTTMWSAGGRLFAVLDGEWAEFRLDPMVARAAMRTPETAVSRRGPDWVTFAPAVLDDPAIDRVEAWFLSAHRLATATRH